MTLVDANILLYAYNVDAPQHAASAAWIDLPENPENLVFEYVNFLRRSSEIVTLNPLVNAPIRDVNDIK